MRAAISVILLITLLAPSSRAQDADAWAERLIVAADEGVDWRAAFSLGQQVAELAPQTALAVLRQTWPRIQSTRFKQQIVKAWHFDLPAPFRVRLQPETFRFFRLVLAEDEPEVSQWVLEYLPTYAWREFADAGEAVDWLDGVTDEDPASTIITSQRSWAERWRAAGDVERERLEGVLSRIGHPHRRNDALTNAAERDGVAALLAELAADPRVGAQARTSAFNCLRSIRPAEYGDDAWARLRSEINEQIEAEVERERLAAERALEQSIRIVDDDARKRWILHPPLDAEPPPRGFGLLLVFPGGDGSASFAPFVAETIRARAGRDFAVVQMIAPPIPEGGGRAIVWPQERLPDDRVDFTIEPVVDRVLAAARDALVIDPARIYTMGWSSGGPPAYALALREDSPIRGGFVIMSVYKPDLLPPRAAAAGRSFYILHSPQDFIAMRFPEAARDDLAAHGVRVRLETYEGGHGWQGDSTSHISRAVRWLDRRDETSAPIRQ